MAVLRVTFEGITVGVHKIIAQVEQSQKEVKLTFNKAISRLPNTVPLLLCVIEAFSKP